MGKAGNVLPNKGRQIKLDKVRHLRYPMGALAWLADRYGSMQKVIEIFFSMGSAENFGRDELYAIADLLCAGMMSEDPGMTPEYVRDTFDLEQIIGIMPDMVAAFTDSLPKPKAVGVPPKA